MRDLDSINALDTKPSRFVCLGAVIPLTFSTFGSVLASNAAPTIPYVNNPIFLFCIAVFTVACFMLLIPRLFRWGWETKYFGVTLFQLGSIALMCVVPCLCFVVYSKLPLGVRAGVFLIVVATHVAWARRFFVFYEKVNNDSELHGSLYEEDEDAVYYMQGADKCLLETQYNFVQLPRDRYIVIFLLIAFALSPVMGRVSSIVGLPFIHVFFMIGTLPISLMGIGFATRGWLVFYYYPRLIRKKTGKRVYVDLRGRRGKIAQKM